MLKLHDLMRELRRANILETWNLEILDVKTEEETWGYSETIMVKDRALDAGRYAITKAELQYDKDSVDIKLWAEEEQIYKGKFESRVWYCKEEALKRMLYDICGPAIKELDKVPGMSYSLRVDLDEVHYALVRSGCYIDYIRWVDKSKKDAELVCTGTVEELGSWL